MRYVVQVLVLALLTCPSAAATTIHVPSDYPTIQAGIDAAAYGDTVLVAGGSYRERPHFRWLPLVLRSESGPEVTYLDGVDVYSYDGGTVDGFTFARDINLEFIRCAGGDYAYPDFVVKNCRFLGHIDRAAVRCDDFQSALHVNHCVFSGLYTQVVVTLGPDCEFINNTVDGGWRGLAMYGENNRVVNNIIANVVGYTMYGPAPSTIVDYNDFYGNGDSFSPGSHGIAVRAQFYDTAGNNYDLLETSPCIGAGSPNPDYPDSMENRFDIGAIPFDSHLMQPYARNLNFGADDGEHIVSHTPAFFWMLDPRQETPQAFEAQISTDSRFRTIDMWSSGVVAGHDTTVQYAGEPLVEGGRYYLRVRLLGSSGWGSWMKRTFHMNSLPSAPIPWQPEDGEVVKITTQWLYVYNSTDPELDSLQYFFEVFDDSTLTDAVSSPIGISQSNWDRTTAYAYGLRAYTWYWWRARAFDGREYSPWSRVRRFYTRPTTKYYVPSDKPTIQAAIEAAESGDTVVVLPGIYYDTLRVTGKAIALISTGGPEQTILDGQRVNTILSGYGGITKLTISGFGFRNTPEAISVSFDTVQIDCCTVDMSMFGQRYGLAIRASGKKVIIRGCDVRNPAYVGISASATRQLIMDKNRIDGVDDPAVMAICDPSAVSQITSNVISNSLGGIRVAGGTQYVAGNSIAGCREGITILPSTTTLTNNIITGSTEYGISGIAALSDYNDLWNNTIDYADSALPGPHDIFADPMFVDAAQQDFRLQCNSPCIDAGDPATPGGYGKAVDIGAYEFPYKIGNVDNDSLMQVDIGDVVTLVNFIFAGGEAPCPTAMGDVQCDGVTDVSDAVYLIQYIFAGGPAPCGSR